MADFYNVHLQFEILCAFFREKFSIMSKSVVELGSDDIFQKLRNGTSFILMYANWCPHCKNYIQEGTLEKLQKKFNNVNFFKFEASSIPEQEKIASEMFKDSNGKPIKITLFPTFVLTDQHGKGPIRFQFVRPEESRSFENQSKIIQKFLQKIQTI